MVCSICVRAWISRSLRLMQGRRPRSQRWRKARSARPLQRCRASVCSWYRAGACLLLVELPTGEAFQSRDPAYLLLKDMLRAAGLPDSPQLLGDPVRWPLLAGGNLDQGPGCGP